MFCSLSPLKIPPNIKVLADCNSPVTFVYPIDTSVGVQVSENDTIQGLILTGNKGPILQINGGGVIGICIITKNVPKA